MDEIEKKELELKGLRREKFLTEHPVMAKSMETVDLSKPEMTRSKTLRADRYARMRRQGLTLQEIANGEDVTRERVRQVLVGAFGSSLNEEAEENKKKARDSKLKEYRFCANKKCGKKFRCFKVKEKKFCNRDCWGKDKRLFDVPILKLSKEDLRKYNAKRGNEYYHKNREKVMKIAAKWRKDNPEKQRAAVKKWGDKNRDKLREYSKKYYYKKKAERLNETTNTSIS